MRWLGLALVIPCFGCYVGPGGGDGMPWDASSSEDGSGDPTGASNPTGASDPTVGGDPTGASDPTGNTSSPQTSDAMSDGMDAPADTVGETTDGGMTGCETGPLPGPIPGCAPAPMPSSGDIYQDCVDRINQFRWECQCLPPLARWSDAETCSDQQSSNDQNGGGPHANFGACGESAQNTCPDWPSEEIIITGCLQAMWDEGPGEPFSEHGHYINMSSTGYTKVACGFSSSGGGVWSNQNFSP